MITMVLLFIDLIAEGIVQINMLLGRTHLKEKELICIIQNEFL